MHRDGRVLGQHILAGLIGQPGNQGDRAVGQAVGGHKVALARLPVLAGEGLRQAMGDGLALAAVQPPESEMPVLPGPARDGWDGELDAALHRLQAAHQLLQHIVLYRLDGRLRGIVFGGLLRLCRELAAAPVVPDRVAVRLIEMHLQQLHGVVGGGAGVVSHAAVRKLGDHLNGLPVGQPPLVMQGVFGGVVPVAVPVIELEPALTVPQALALGGRAGLHQNDLLGAALLLPAHPAAHGFPLADQLVGAGDGLFPRPGEGAGGEQHHARQRQGDGGSPGLFRGDNGL